MVLQGVAIDLSATPIGVTASPFSARWSGFLVPGAAGWYDLSVTVDGQARVLIDRQVILDTLADSTFVGQGPRAYSLKWYMQPLRGTHHEVQVDYRSIGAASPMCQLEWRGPSFRTEVRVFVPVSCFVIPTPVSRTLRRLCLCGTWRTTSIRPTHHFPRDAQLSSHAQKAAQLKIPV